MYIKRMRFYEISLLLLFKALLDFVYIFYVSDIYGYTGFTLDIDIIKCLESYLLLLFTYFFLNNSEKQFSAIILNFLYLFMLVPTLSLYGLKNESRFFLYSLVISFLITVLISNLPMLKIPRLKNTKSLLVFIIPVLTLITYIILIIYNGLPSLRAFNFSSLASLLLELVFVFIKKLKTYYFRITFTADFVYDNGS